MRFFNADLHISVIADIKRIFADHGHEVVDKCLSGHYWVMGRKQDRITELSGGRWANMVYQWSFNKFYDAHPSLKEYDGFIVTYPPIWAMLYERYNKPIIVQIPIRYDYGVHGSPELLARWNEWLRVHVKSGQVILVANNRYDVEYCRLQTGLTPQHIPSLCEYFPKRGPGTRAGFIQYEQGPDLGNEVPGIVQRAKALPLGWKWPTIHKYKGVVHLPYQVSTMSTFEQYTANVPQLFPSAKYLTDMYFGGWGVLSQVSTFQYASSTRHVGSIVPIDGPLDPNDWKSRDVVEKLWLPLADYYDTDWMREVLLFGSTAELRHLCETTDFEFVSARMTEHNIVRKMRVYESWSKVLKGLGA